MMMMTCIAVGLFIGVWDGLLCFVIVCRSLLYVVSCWGLAPKGTIRRKMGPVKLVALVLVSTPTSVHPLTESETIPKGLSSRTKLGI